MRVWTVCAIVVNVRWKAAPLTSPPRLPSAPRRPLPLGAGVAGPRRARSGVGVPAPLRVLPVAHDRELPGAELHRRPRGSAVRVPARVPPEQPDHGAQSRIIWLRNSGRNEGGEQ